MFGPVLPQHQSQAEANWLRSCTCYPLTCQNAVPSGLEGFCWSLLSSLRAAKPSLVYAAPHVPSVCVCENVNLHESAEPQHVRVCLLYSDKRVADSPKLREFLGHVSDSGSFGSQQHAPP